METINSSMECVPSFHLYFSVIVSQFPMLNSRFLGAPQWHPIASFSLSSPPHVFSSWGALNTLILCRSKLSIPMVSLPLRKRVHRTGLGTIWQGSPQSHCVGRKGSLHIPWPGGLPHPAGEDGVGGKYGTVRSYGSLWQGDGASAILSPVLLQFLSEL